MNIKNFWIIFVVLGLNFAIINASQRENDHKTQNRIENRQKIVCKNTECKELAEIFKNAMNRSIDPCENFYQFACQNWEFTSPKPKFVSGNWNEQGPRQLRVLQNLREELERNSTLNDVLPVQLAKKWYNSCMSQEVHGIREIQKIDSILKEIGGWPMIINLHDRNNQKTSWQDVDKFYLRLTGHSAFFTLKALTTIENNKIIYIDLPPTVLDKIIPTVLENNIYEKLLMDYVVRLFIENNKINISDKQLKNDINDVINFHEKLQRIITEFNSFSPVKRRSNEINETTEIIWNDILEIINDIGSLKIDEIIFWNNNYFQELNKILKSTDKQTIINYIHWNFVITILKETTAKVEKKIFDLVKDEKKLKEQSPRWLQCLQNAKISDAFAFVYVKKYFKNITENFAVEVITNIAEELGNQILNSNWMSNELKNTFIDKLYEMRIFLGFPEWWKNETALLIFYDELVVGENYMDNLLSFMRYELKRNLRPPITDVIQLNPLEVNAGYSKQSNYLSLPAAKFQSPFFDPNVPNYVNYAMAGFSIGHEMGHGFDPTGINYEPNGKATLLNDEMFEIYSDMSECFLKLFGEHYEKAMRSTTNLTAEPMAIEIAEITHDENIADWIGLETAWSVYQELKNSVTLNEEPKLPGFEDFTDDQMFFISHAQMWCAASSPTSGESLPDDTHSLNYLRVIGTLSNNLDFAKVFNCPKNSPMNPENKCNMWMKSH